MGLKVATKRIIIIALVFVVTSTETALIIGKIDKDSALLIIVPIITGFFGLLKSDD